MTTPFSEQNPYTAPIEAELVERPKKKQLPVAAVALLLVLTFIVGASLSVLHPLWMFLFPAACIGVLAWFCAYDLWRWFTS